MQINEYNYITCIDYKYYIQVQSKEIFRKRWNWLLTLIFIAKETSEEGHHKDQKNELKDKAKPHMFHDHLCQNHPKGKATTFTT